MRSTPLVRHARLERTSRLKSSRGPIDKAARKRRRQGGKRAVGRDSMTLAELDRERAYVFERDHHGCVLCRVWCSTCERPHDRETGGCHIPATDFAHVRSRAQGGDDTRFNALATCNPCNLKMSMRPFRKGCPVVTAGSLNGIRGFHVEWVKCSGKIAYRLGDYALLAHAFIAAEKA